MIGQKSRSPGQKCEFISQLTVKVKGHVVLWLKVLVMWVKVKGRMGQGQHKAHDTGRWAHQQQVAFFVSKMQYMVDMLHVL